MLNGLKFTIKVAIGQMTLSVGGEKGEVGHGLVCLGCAVCLVKSSWNPFCH